MIGWFIVSLINKLYWFYLEFYVFLKAIRFLNLYGDKLTIIYEVFLKKKLFIYLLLYVTFIVLTRIDFIRNFEFETNNNIFQVGVEVFISEIKITVS